MKNELVKQFMTILNSANYQLSDIAGSVKAISTDPWVKIGSVVSLIVAIIAIYAANKDYFNNCFFKPKICVNKDVLTLQQNTSRISRLTITNFKKKIAKNVAFWIDELWYCENNKWMKASNFLQFPLRWTHLDVEHRDLYYLRPYALDLCEIYETSVYETLDDRAPSRQIGIRLCTLCGGPSVHGLDDLKIGKSRIRMALFCDNHPAEHHYVEISWNGSSCKPDFKITKIGRSPFIASGCF